MKPGILIEWNEAKGRGIVVTNDGTEASFEHGHKDDRAAFKAGVAVVCCIEEGVALDVQLATAAFLRYASIYTPD